MVKITKLQEEILARLPGIELRMHEPMSKHTSFKIGGPAEVMAFPKTSEELAKILKQSALLDCKTAIIGAGTNILAPDEGLEGLVICLKDCFSGMELLDKTRIRIAAGVTMARAAVFAAEHDLGGMEFAHGIPGTVGGGVYMNAGAYGSEIKDVCESVSVMYRDGSIADISAQDMDFSYRHSRLEREEGIVIGAVFALTPRPESEIRERMQELLKKRKTSQPLEYPSAGSAFKRPVGGYAAALIDEAGLKGYTVGGAQISGKHAGFIINANAATAADVKALLKKTAETVYAYSGILLEPEIRIW